MIKRQGIEFILLNLNFFWRIHINHLGVMIALMVCTNYYNERYINKSLSNIPKLIKLLSGELTYMSADGKQTGRH